jgi:hypothetical protein
MISIENRFIPSKSLFPYVSPSNLFPELRWAPYASNKTKPPVNETLSAGRLRVACGINGALQKTGENRPATV